MQDLSMLYMALSIMLLVAGVCVLGLALFCYVHARRMDNLPAAVSGEVIGLVKMRFFGRKTLGEVPYHTYASYNGGFATPLFPWVPCVRYTVGGREYIRLRGEGVREDLWYIGQRVTVRYDPAAPGISSLDSDPSPYFAARLQLYAGLALLLTGLVAVTVCVTRMRT